LLNPANSLRVNQISGMIDNLLESIRTSPDVRLAVKLAYYRRNPEAYFVDQLKIRTKKGTLDHFALWPCQTPVLEKIMAQRKRKGWIRMVVLKARQVGMSTFSEGLMAWSVMLNPNTNGIIVAHDAPTAETLFMMTKTFYDYMDPDIKPAKRYSTKKEFVFENPDDDLRPTDPGLGSRLVITSANNIHSGIGRTLRAVHISEAARYPNAEGIVDGIFPALAKEPGTVAIIESTARYSGGWFKGLCERSKVNDGDFEFVFVPWFLNHEYRVPLLPGEQMQLSLDEKHMMKEFGLTVEQIKFFRQELATLGDEALFRQSYPLTEEDAWITPGDNVFPWDKIDALKKKAREMGGPLRICDILPGGAIMDNPQGKLLIWEEPTKGKHYDIGVDVALGTARNDKEEYAADDEQGGDWSGM